MEIDKVGFDVIEPPIYNAFDWEMSALMKALTYIQSVLPIYLTCLPEDTKYYLIDYGDFLGGRYPAIGFVSKSSIKNGIVFDFLAINDLVEDIVINQLGLDKIRADSENVEVITWEQLQVRKYYRPVN